MAPMRGLILGFTVFVLLFGGASAFAEEVLPSWNEGPAKREIVDFVEAVTREGSPDFVPENERIAVFDNDGTLWAEKPVYPEWQFAREYYQELLPEHPEWKEGEPIASLLRGDWKGVAASGSEAIARTVTGAYSRMTTEEFAGVVRHWIGTARHPETGRPYTEMFYQPMRELLDYLRSKRFKTFIVSGGGRDFLRGYAERLYGILPEEVVGSTLKVRYETSQGGPVLIRTGEIELVDDREGKVLGIHESIGRRPIAAFGNSDGDLEMLEYAAAGTGKRLCLLVHHTDNVREWAYDRGSSVGRLDKALGEAKARGWTVVDMKQDWRRVFPFEEKDPILAIDILLDPDEVMTGRAEGLNKMLREDHPAGYAFDATHHPHLTLLQRYVRASELERIYAAIERVLAQQPIGRLRLKADAFYYGSGKVTLAGIRVEPSDELRQLQDELVKAIQPFAVKEGTPAAFVHTPQDPAIEPETMKHVANYVPRSVRERFFPHVTVGLGNREFLEDLSARDFEPFAFSPSGLSVYQLGNFGTARKRMKSWPAPKE